MNGTPQLRFPFTNPKGFDYATLKIALDEGRYLCDRVEHCRDGTIPDELESIRELHEGAGFRPRFDPPPNT